MEATMNNFIRFIFLTAFIATQEINAFNPSNQFPTKLMSFKVQHIATPTISIKKTHSLNTPTTFSLSADAGSVHDDDDLDSQSSTTMLSKINKWRKKLVQKKNPDDLTFRQKLGKMGLSVLLSYGFVSNMSYVVSVTLAWYGFTKKTGLSPLAPGQWKSFLAVYAGFYVFNSFVRPLRLGLAAYISTYFDRIIAFAQRKTNCSKSVAIGLVVFFANIVGTTTLMCLGITLASAASGVPIFVTKAVAP